jgi:hypothetical protein
VAEDALLELVGVVLPVRPTLCIAAPSTDCRRGLLRLIDPIKALSAVLAAALAGAIKYRQSDHLPDAMLAYFR